MTPFGHIATSYLIGKSHKYFIISAIILGGLAPDLDLILIPFKIFNEYHRVLTHNILFVSIFSFMLILFDNKNRSWLVLLSALIGGLFHLFIDSILDNNPSNGIGVAWFWPFSDVVLSPFNLISEKHYQPEGWDNFWQMAKNSLHILYFEIPIILGGLFVFFKLKKKTINSI